MSEPTVDRRGALRATAAGAAAVGVAATAAAPASAAEPETMITPFGPLRVRKKLQVVDRDGKQRFLMQSTKPPVYVNGEKLPASERSGPEDGSYFLFNDETQNERGGITVAPGIAQLTLDWPSTQAVSLSANVLEGDLPLAMLAMQQRPDPSIPPEDLTPADAPTRVMLGTAPPLGAVLSLNDSSGKTRIALQVDGQDQARIVIFDGAGNVVAQIPESSEPASPEDLSLPEATTQGD